MRVSPRALAAAAFALPCVVALVASGCGLEQLASAGKGAEGGAPADGGEAGDGATWTGQGCGVEGQSGMQLCAATSMCPNVVVDTQVFPHCGFRIRGSAIDLVCGCNGFVCPMGVFTTCAQATQLLTQQTEAAVCTQVNEGRCTAAPGSPSGSSGSSGSGGACDKQCLKECGGGAGCASLCNCS
jgi:hypothetical protein